MDTIHSEILNKFLRYFQKKDENIALTDFVSKTCISHGTCIGFSDVETIDELPSFLNLIHNSLSGFKVEVKDVISESNKLFFRFEGSGIHDGLPLLGVPPTNRKIVYNSFNVYLIENNKVIEHWGNSDLYQKLL